MIEGTAVEIVDGYRVLGPVRGNEIAYETFKLTTAGEYANLLKKLEQVAKTSPQNAYACLTRGLQQKLCFLSKITEYRSRSQYLNARPTVVL